MSHSLLVQSLHFKGSSQHKGTPRYLTSELSLTLNRKLHQQFEIYKDQVKKLGEEPQAAHMTRAESPTCGICHKTKFADGCGRACCYCQSRFCARCGGRVPLRANKVCDLKLWFVFTAAFPSFSSWFITRTKLEQKRDLFNVTPCHFVPPKSPDPQTEDFSSIRTWWDVEKKGISIKLKINHIHKFIKLYVI